MEYCFEKNGLIYVFKRNSGETDAYFYRRCKYVCDRQPKTKKCLDKLLLEAYKDCNVNLLNCSYK
jgi:hypothetical protein